MNRSLAGSGEGGFYHPTCPGRPLLSHSITTTYEPSSRARHCRPNTVHLPIRRRTAGLGSSFLCHYLETPTNRETVSCEATLWQLLHGRLGSYTHSQVL